MCSVVPAVTPLVSFFAREKLGVAPWALTARTVRGIGIDYPKPQTIGADRLANALAARQGFGAPVAVVDFGTAVTFDIVDRRGNYIGGIIAPGLEVMTDYLHEKTALLPRIKIREVAGRGGQKYRASHVDRRGAWLSRPDSRTGRRNKARPAAPPACRWSPPAAMPG